MSEILNSFVDIVKARRDYRDFRWSVIEDTLNMSFAERVIQNIVRNVEFKTSFLEEDVNVEMSDAQINELPKEKQQELFQQIHLQASDGKGYLYAKKALDDLSDNPAIGAIGELQNWLKSDECIELIEDISGQRGLSLATLEIARFSQGQFLTTTNGIIGGDNRKIGFIFDLTPNWQSDWGGLLHLHPQESDEPSRAFVPRFNQLILFDAKHNFSISVLAPFIKFYKYTIFGWFDAV